MNIYVCHSMSYDFKNDLYNPLRNSTLNKKYNIIFPHEVNNRQFFSKKLFQSKKCDLIIAEVSFPSTGEGIELGWADSLQIPISCIYKKDSKLSSALRMLTNKFIEYENSSDLIQKLLLEIKNYE